MAHTVDRSQRPKSLTQKQLSRESPDRDLDAGQCDESGEALRKVFIILGDAAVTAKPGEGSLDDPAAWQDDEAFQVVAALDDLKAQHRNFGDGSLDLPSIIAIIGPDEFEPGEAIADLVEDEGRPVTILDTRGVNDDPYWQSFSVDERMDFAPLDLLAGVIAYLAVKTAPFSAAFSAWLSMTAAVGLASRPRRSRKVMCSSSQMASHTPSFWNLRKML
jgi:hypothetical protein